MFTLRIGNIDVALLYSGNMGLHKCFSEKHDVSPSRALCFAKFPRCILQHVTEEDEVLSMI